MCYQQFTSALYPHVTFCLTFDMCSYCHIELPFSLNFISFLWLQKSDYAALFFFDAFYQWTSHVDMPHYYLYSRDSRNQLVENKRRVEVLMAVNIKECGILRYDCIKFDRLGTEVSEEPTAITWRWRKKVSYYTAIKHIEILWQNWCCYQL